MLVGTDARTAHGDGLDGSPPASNQWSGAYFGGSVSYSWWGSRASVGRAPPSPEAFSNTTGGLHIGTNYLLGRSLLVGAELDGSFANFIEDDDLVLRRATSASTITEQVDFVARLRARFGFVAGGTLFYATTGPALSQARVIEAPGATSATDKQLRIRTGWSIGTGVERALTPEWVARLEYSYDKLDRIHTSFRSGQELASTLDTHALRVGLSRRLGERATDADAQPRAAQSRDWTVHGQATYIEQAYPSFRSPYEGPNSLQGRSQIKNTVSATAFVGWRPMPGTEVYVNPELMQGFGFNHVHGVAGFPNGEAQKSDFPVPRFNIARAYVKQTFGFGGEQEEIEDGPNQIAGRQDVSRLTVMAGKMVVADVFNGNLYAGEPRTGFMNWNIYGGGSYDLTMDKLSYTWGALADLNQRTWALRFGYFLLPIVSNDNKFDTHIPERGEYIGELELRYALFSQPGKLRLMGWAHRGNMGGYPDSLAMPTSTPDYPDIAATRRIRSNYGVLVNVEQALTDDIGIFSRASWSPGRVEIMGWTDTDESLSLGMVVKGSSWNRPDDRIGVAGVIEGLSPEARAFFAAGGLGILIGDGRLNYRPEKVLEAYYAYSLNRWATITGDYQFITNPGYNVDRGPVSVFSSRLRAAF